MYAGSHPDKSPVVAPFIKVGTSPNFLPFFSAAEIISPPSLDAKNISPKGLVSLNSLVCLTARHLSFSFPSGFKIDDKEYSLSPNFTPGSTNPPNVPIATA